MRVFSLKVNLLLMILLTGEKMHRLANDPSDFFRTMASNASIEAKSLSLNGYANQIGFKDTYYARIIDPTHETPRVNSNVFSLRHADEEWQRVYEGENLASYDWAREYAAEAHMPFRLDQPPSNLTGPQTNFLDIARKFNRQNGFAFPIRGAFGVVAGFSATAAEKRPTDIQIAQLTSAVQFFDLMVGKDVTKENAHLYSLTEREIRLLRLYITGRSMTQIALLLGKSEQWIRRSFLRMRAKTNVSTNSELIYRASRLRII